MSKVNRYLLVLMGCLLIGCMGGGLCHSQRVEAYTEEQKQQAKAWLSAHGYSADAAGANQAYQDYLAGKYDSNGNVVEDKSDKKASSSKKKAKKKAAKKQASKKKPSDTASEQEDGSGDMQSSQEENPASEGETQGIDNLQQTKEALKEELARTGTPSAVSTLAAVMKRISAEHTRERLQKERKSRQIGIILLVGIGVLGAGAGMLLMRRQRK